jgi:hypothetical protein
MLKKTRLIILLACVACFFLIAPILVAYSEGYRFDFKEMKVVATGGIYVRSFPSAGQITIDSKISEKPGMFSGGSIFVQSLLPESHTVSIKKTGYYDYFKTLPVQENQVTKLENVLLIKNSLAFSSIDSSVNYFSIAPNNQSIITSSTSTKNITFSYSNLNNQNPAKTFLITQLGTVSGIKWSDDSSKALLKVSAQNGQVFYYFFDTTALKPVAVRLTYLDKNSQEVSFNPQDPPTVLYIENNTLYSAKGNVSLPIISNILSFKISDANILWISTKGVLSSSDLTGKATNKIPLSNFTVTGKNSYELLSILGDTLLKENNSLFKLNQNTKTFEIFEIPTIKNYKILSSPDSKNVVFWNSDKIYLYSPISNIDSPEEPEFTLLYSGSQITNCQWLNNDYIIFASGDKIIISEIDYRGNINATTLPQTITLPAEPVKNPSQEATQVEIKSPQVFFNQTDNKLYILTQGLLLASEKITP